MFIHLIFTGLTLESGKRYAQKVEASFHVSMAALDLKSAGSGIHFNLIENNSQFKFTWQ